MTDPITELASDRAALQRSSTAERVAGILRERITDGTLAPGTRLPEDALGTALGVSRNTLREAFRLLIHERLVVAELNRGAFVRRLTSEDVVDLYRVRQLVEGAAIRSFGIDPGAEGSGSNPGADTGAGSDTGSDGSSGSGSATSGGTVSVDGDRQAHLAVLRSAVDEGRIAAKEDRWPDVATANMHFHRAVVALAGSARLDEYMRQVSAELRLAFHVMQNPRTFHEPYLGRNGEILERLEAGDVAGAADLLVGYLQDAERQVVAGYQEAGAE